MSLPTLARFASVLALAPAAAPQGPAAPAWEKLGSQAQAKFGESLAPAGDVNGDGFADVIVGARGERRAYVYLGSAAGLATSPVWFGTLGSGDYARSVASAGDVNGDGFDDVLVGADSFTGGFAGEGAAFVYHGSPAGPSLAPSWTALGNQASSHFGERVAGAGDVNGDGYDDVLVGAADFDNGQTDEGRAFLYLGSATGLATGPAWTAESDQVDANLVTVASAGDVNGDGYDDVLVGAPLYDSASFGDGRASLYLGSATGPATTPAWTMDGFDYGSFFGDVLAGLDANGDGYDDVLVGWGALQFVGFDAFYYTRATLFLGSAAGLSTQPSWTVTQLDGDADYGYDGISVANAGDVNGDGRDDALVGTPGFEYELFVDDERGRAKLYLGTPAGLAPQPVWSIDGPVSHMLFGCAVAGADVDGDGFHDVLVGAWSDSTSLLGAGRVRLYAGEADFVSTAVFAGDGINADTIEPVNVMIGTRWNAPVVLGHAHGASGVLQLLVKSATTNGPNVPSPSGGRLTELLVSGATFASVFGTHDGSRGNIANQRIPSQAALLGLRWAAQYVVAGGGFADYSLAVRGAIGKP